ncbi:hypothetical protein [Streptomyces sp. NPDC021224]|uniref:hypothetical protein n=1 Tax=unclassified Streptomyces TaxID=2593676 RepID=UPI0037ACB4FE
MANRDGVRVDLDSIFNALETNGFDEVRVEFAPDDGGGAAAFVEVVRQATNEANDLANEAAPDSIWGSLLTASLAGFSVRLGSIWSEEALHTWLAAFGDRVRVGGLSGELRATKTVRLPAWDSPDPMMTAYVALGKLSGLDGAGRSGWAGRAVRWAAEAGGDAYVGSSGMSQLDTTGEVSVHLASMLQVASSGAVLYADGLASRAAMAEIGSDGQAMYQTHDASASLAAAVDRARAAILAEAEHAHYAFVAPTPRRAYGWDARGRALPPLREGIPANALYTHADLWGRLVPDVHGMQLLTDEHLDRVADLSQWTVTHVAAGRTLVEASDLAEWLGPGGPALSVLDQARADFGRALVPADDVR